MMHLTLFSRDPKLAPLLRSALQSECILTSTDNQTALNSGSSDILLLDCDENYVFAAEQLELCDRLGELKIPTVVLTNDTRRIRVAEFLRRGVFDFIRKPPALPELRIVLRRAFERAAMDGEIARMRAEREFGAGCDQLVGSSGRAQVVYDLIRRVADLSVSVLITGESGTGKELVARAIHNTGERSRHPFVAVSCGAIPDSLIEAELFGHESGAFTGATGARAGYLEQAGRGTILLDEIGELRPHVQVKLLRVLQEHEFCRLGSNRPIPLNARLLFATHRNLKDMVEQESFRADLFFRINVMTIGVPPLRERTEDIPTLARYFLGKYSEEYRKAVTDIRPCAMEALVEYSWAGNVRELENVIQKAVIMADGRAITRTDLPDPIKLLVEDEDVIASEPDSFDELLRRFKIDLVNRTVAECNGNKSLAARRLRVSRTYLHKLIQTGASQQESATPEFLSFSGTDKLM